ncbi:MAG: hypothetical protein WCL46_07285 [Chlorobium sp.]
MNILILSFAEEEFAEAVDYYNEQCPRLGYEFAAQSTYVATITARAWSLQTSPT